MAELQEGQIEALLSALEEHEAASNPIPMWAVYHIARIPRHSARWWLTLRGVYHERGGWYLSSQVMKNRPSPYHHRLMKIFKVV